MSAADDIRLRAEVNRWAMPIPRFRWYFEGTYLFVGLSLGTNFSDPVVSVGFAGELSPRRAGQLCDLLELVTPRICRVFGHRYEPVVNDPETGAPRSQCRRCLDLIERSSHLMPLHTQLDGEA